MRQSTGQELESDLSDLGMTSYDRQQAGQRQILYAYLMCAAHI